MNDHIQLTVDGKKITVPKGTTVYQATKMLGVEIPIFCYQDRMPPFGACRVCLVEVENMPKLQTSCTLECKEGMVVKTQADEAVKARKEILEFLLINHPLDCPICDRGGECPLQDQAEEFGPGKSRFFEDKRRYEKPMPLGPVLTLDRERCIQCARCTRFGELIAGDHALEFIDRGHKMEVGTSDGGPAKSKFIGNTIMICPVGALTSSVYRFRARPWDNDTVDSTCTLCPVGCSMKLDSRDGEIVRVRSKENRDVNDIWLCDKGWFGYEFSSSDTRLTAPLVRKNGELQEVSWDEAFSLVSKKMQEAKPQKKLAALGGAKLTCEENYLLQKLMREGLGVENVDYRVGDYAFSLDDEGISSGMEISLGCTEALSHIVILGADITEEFPVLWLRLRQAINKGAKVCFFGHYKPEISRYFDKVILHAPGREMATLTDQKDTLLTFLQGPKCALFIGRQYLATQDRKAILSELFSLKNSHSQLSVNMLEGSGNSMGARFSGMHPELLPFGKRNPSPGKSTEQVFTEAKNSGWDFLYVVGSDPASKLVPDEWEAVRQNTQCIVVQDLFMTKTATSADIVLPTVGFIEKGGSFLNIESRVQKLKPGKTIPKGVFSDAYIFARLSQRLRFSLVIDEEFLDALKPERLQISYANTLDKNSGSSHRNQEGLFVTFAPSLIDQSAQMKHNHRLVELAKEPKIRMHPSDCSERGIQDADMVTVSMKGRTLSAQVAIDSSVSPKCVVVLVGFDTLNAYTFGMHLINGMPVDVSVQQRSK